MNGLDLSSSLLLLLIEDPKAKIIWIMHIIEPGTTRRPRTRPRLSASPIAIRVRPRDPTPQPSPWRGDPPLIAERVTVPVHLQRLSLDPALLLPQAATAAAPPLLLSDPAARLASLNLANGSFVYLSYPSDARSSQSPPLKGLSFVLLVLFLLLGLGGAAGGGGGGGGRGSSVYPAAVVYPHHSRQISWKPRVFLYQHFLSNDEANHLVSLARAELKRSAVADNMSGKSTLSDVRTSSGTFISKAKKNRISISMELVTAVFGDHGQRPKDDYAHTIRDQKLPMVPKKPAK